MAAVAGDDVGIRVAAAAVGSAIGEAEILGISAERVGVETGSDFIRAFVGVFGDDVSDVVNEVSVVASATNEAVCPCAAI